MFSFKEFNEEMLIVEAIKYTDRTFFRNVLNGKYEMSKKELKEWERNQSLINEGRKKKKSNDDLDLDDDFEDDNFDDEEEDKEVTEKDFEDDANQKPEKDYSNINYLNNDEEIELLKKYKANPTSQEGLDAMNKVAENKMPYVYKKVGDFINIHPQYASKRTEMISDASYGLTNAINKFDPNSGTIFTGFAKKYIVGGILNAINTNRHSSLDQGKKGATSVSVDQKISGGRGGTDKDMSIGDLIRDYNITSNPEEYVEKEEQRALLSDWISQLPDAEKTAIEMYYPTDDRKPATYQQIGNKLGMTAMGAKKIVDRVIAKLRDFANDPKFGKI